MICKPCLRRNAANLIAVGLALRRPLQVEEPPVPARNLDARKAQPRRPACHAFQRVEGRCIARKLRQKNSRPFDGLHIALVVLFVAKTGRRWSVIGDR